MQAIETVRIQAKELIVVGTIRTQQLDSKFLIEQLEVFRFWRHVNIPDWDDSLGKSLASLTGVSFERWDKTPLSVKSPSGEASLKLAHSSSATKLLGFAANLAAHFEINPISLASLKMIYASSLVEGDLSDFDLAFTSLKDIGVITAEQEEILIYDSHLHGSKSDFNYDKEALALADLFISAGAWMDALAIAEWALERGLFKIVDEVTSKTQQMNPNNANTWYLKGRLATRREDYPLAIEYFSSAATLRPGWATSWVRLANAYEKMGEANEARIATQRAIGVSKGRTTWSRVASIVAILKEENRLEEAINLISAWQKTRLFSEIPTIALS